MFSWRGCKLTASSSTYENFKLWHWKQKHCSSLGAAWLWQDGISKWNIPGLNQWAKMKLKYFFHSWKLTTKIDYFLRSPDVYRFALCFNESHSFCLHFICHRIKILPLDYNFLFSKFITFSTINLLPYVDLGKINFLPRFKYKSPNPI